MNQLLNQFADLKKSSINKSRKCMFSNCENNAINSHVLQKNGILNEISINGHIIERVNTDIYRTEENGIVDFKKIGINNAYSFLGFCKFHDSEIFKPIEDKKNLNLEIKLHQALFCYRGLCQEIRRKEIGIELTEAIKYHNPIQYLMIESLKNGLKNGIKNLNYYKLELEKSISNNVFEHFYFETIKIPRIELCISVPLNIEDISNIKTKDDNIPFVTSFLNLFPNGDSSYIVIGYHKDYPCFWTDNLVNKIKNGTKSDIFKELSDLISLRLEFWAMSISLFQSLSKTNVDILRYSSMDNTFNHSIDLKTKLDLFKHLS